MPKRIQMSRQKPWRADNPDAVIVDRRTLFGNPFKVGDPVDVWWYSSGLSVHGSITAESASEAVAYYRDWMNGEVEVTRVPRAGLRQVEGKDLACWCPLDQPCHADVLLELANA